jgi:hypothetical protein
MLIVFDRCASPRGVAFERWKSSRFHLYMRQWATIYLTQSTTFFAEPGNTLPIARGIPAPPSGQPPND